MRHISFNRYVSFDCNGGCGCPNAKIGKFVGAWIRLCSGLMRKKFVKDDRYCCLISNIYVKKDRELSGYLSYLYFINDKMYTKPTKFYSVLCKM